jgi:hypothetical protein
MCERRDLLRTADSGGARFAPIRVQYIVKFAIIHLFMSLLIGVYRDVHNHLDDIAYASLPISIL